MDDHVRDCHGVSLLQGLMQAWFEPNHAEHCHDAGEQSFHMKALQHQGHASGFLDQQFVVPVSWPSPRQQHLSSFLDAGISGMQPSIGNQEASFLDAGNKVIQPSVGHDEASHDGDDHGAVVSAYHSSNRQVFLFAMPITVALAAAFEFAKDRLAETDLSAPLPEVVESAEKEEETLSMSSGLKVLYPYFTGPSRVKCAGYATAHVLLLGLSLYVDVVLTQWNGAFWAALQSHQSERFYSLLWDFLVITGVTGFVGTYSTYINGMWHLHGRDHLTQYFNNLWIRDGAMCVMQQCDTPVDNPDQRIEEDVDEFVSSSREVFFGALAASARLAVYLPMLVHSAPPHLLGFVFAWPVFGAATTHMLGRSLIPLSVAAESANANFRTELLHARDKADNLALMQAGAQLEHSLRGHFETIKRVAYAEFDISKILNFFKMLYDEYGNVVPFVLLAPAFFRGDLDLGSLMQLRMVVARVSESLAFPVNAYSQLVSWRVAADRLAALQAQAIEVRDGNIARRQLRLAEAGHAPHLLSVNTLLAENVTIRTPQGRDVLTNFGLRVEARERVLVVIPASHGKSLLIRALAGLWIHMSGRIETPDDCMFIQGFDFPPMSLRSLLAYPTSMEGDLELVLHAVGASSLIQHTKAEAINWGERLSREQKERVQLARLLLRCPQFAVLDEPLSSLEDEEACNLMASLPQDIAVLTLSRSQRLAAAHSRVIDLQFGVETTFVQPTRAVAPSQAMDESGTRSLNDSERSFPQSGKRLVQARPARLGRMPATT